MILIAFFQWKSERILQWLKHLSFCWPIINESRVTSNCVCPRYRAIAWPLAYGGIKPKINKKFNKFFRVMGIHFTCSIISWQIVFKLQGSRISRLEEQTGQGERSKTIDRKEFVMPGDILGSCQPCEVCRLESYRLYEISGTVSSNEGYDTLLCPTIQTV